MFQTFRIGEKTIKTKKEKWLFLNDKNNFKHK